MPFDLTQRTTFRTQALAQQLIVLTETRQLPALASTLNAQPFITLGSGSNVLFAHDFAGIVLVNQLRGVEILDENSTHAVVSVAAGENWHALVCKMSAQGLHGLENLALIPGTVGAAPVQNIGAYGVEIADFIDRVQVFDLCDNCSKTLAAADCHFRYRDSLFKQAENRNRFIITGVTLRLQKTFAPVLTYQGLAEPIDGDAPPTPAQLLSRVVSIRQSKLPDPSELPNAGSFFKNPVVSREQFACLHETYDDAPCYDIDAAHVKIPAAWLIEKAGFKGHHRDNGAGVYEKHALILVNRGAAHGRDIYALACDIMEAVRVKFGITIEPEVRLVGV